MSNEPTTEVAVDRERAIALMKHDLNYFSAVLMPEVYKFEWPPYYQQLFRVVTQALLKEKDFSKYALGLPRGFAKTTFMKLVQAWAVLFTNKQYIVNIGTILPTAEDFLGDVINMLSHENVTALFGSIQAGFTKNITWEKETHFCGRKIKFLAVGANGTLRGRGKNHRRPQLIILDDVQNKNDEDSDSSWKTLFSWFFGTMQNTRDPSGCQYVFAGNMYNGKYCLLDTLVQHKEWISLVAGAITADGKSLWEELWPTELILRDFRAAEENPDELVVFLAEIFNIRTKRNFGNLDPTRIKTTHWTRDMSEGSYIVIDPSGSKKYSAAAREENSRHDDTAVGVYHIYDGVPQLEEVHSKVLNPIQTIDLCLSLAQQHRASLIVCEAVAYQSTLLFWFDFVMQKLNYPKSITLRPVSPKAMPKIKRIMDGISYIHSGRLTVGEQARPYLVQQAMDYNPADKKPKDDILDVMAYGIPVFTQYRNDIKYPFEVVPNKPRVAGRLAKF